MICPACSNNLTPVTIGSVTVDVCNGGCGGIWFDAFELRQVDEACEIAGDPLARIVRDPGLRVDGSVKRPCPRCDGVKLTRHFFSRQRRVEVDHCPGCGGYWLDAGELQRIHEETSQHSNALPRQQPTLSSTVLRQVYDLRSGKPI